MSICIDYTSDLEREARDEIIGGEFGEEYLVDRLREVLAESIDGQLVYTSDIVDYWIRAGYPDPVEVVYGEPIIDSITRAVYETLSEDCEYQVYDALDAAVGDIYDELIGGEGAHHECDRKDMLGDLYQHYYEHGGF